MCVLFATKHVIYRSGEALYGGCSCIEEAVYIVKIHVQTVQWKSRKQSSSIINLYIRLKHIDRQPSTIAWSHNPDHAFTANVVKLSCKSLLIESKETFKNPYHEMYRDGNVMFCVMRFTVRSNVLICYSLHLYQRNECWHKTFYWILLSQNITKSTMPTESILLTSQMVYGYFEQCLI